ncbi:MAG TPA: hypothetical protein VGI81_07295 [Tepidisphaeraceae bacterium]
MKTRTLLTALVYRGAALLLGVGLAGMSGCAAGPGTQELTLRSTGQNKSFVQQFANAYIGRAGDGDVDVVLVDRATEQRLDGGVAGSPQAPVRQVMHLRILWNPKRDQKADHSVASNATVHWYVMGNTPSTAAGVLEYSGTAFVTLDEDAEPAELTIRNASMRPVACRGGLCDPVGASTLAGTVRARADRHRVYQALDTVRTAIAAAATAKPESASSMAR